VLSRNVPGTVRHNVPFCGECAGIRCGGTGDDRCHGPPPPSHPGGSSAWWGVVEAVFLPVLAVCWVGSVAGQAASYRRSSGERRQQLKWLLAGSAIAGIGIPLAVWLSATHGVLAGLADGIAGACGQLGIPVCMGVAILKYRLLSGMT
jgi:hypothetical protein